MSPKTALKTAFLTTLLLVTATAAFAQSKVVISQVFGGGGNSGAIWKNDFIELYNAGDTAQSLAGWSVQYTSASGTGTWTVTTLSGTIQPGHYYLVQEAAGSNTAAPALPTPDAIGTIAMSSSAGKVALVSSATALTGACPASAVDFVGFGSVNCSEGNTSTAVGAPTLTNTTAALRNGGGCADTNVNSADFASGTPAPRNSASSVNGCLSIGNVSLPEGNSGTTAFNFPVKLNVALGGNVTFNAATADGTATAGSDYTALASTGFTILAGQTTATVTVNVTGDTASEPDETFFVNLSSVSGANLLGTNGTTLQATGTIQNDDASGPSLTLVPASLSSVAEGTLYSQSFTVTNGAGCTFSSSGALPPGLSLSPAGELSGMPTFSGTFGFTITAACTNGSIYAAYSMPVTMACEAGTKTSTPIHAVQGSGMTSPIVGQAVEVEGIVVGNFRGTGQLNGFFLQEPDASWDSDPATSEGVFVYGGTYAGTINVGDRLRVKGTVAEYTSSGVSLTEVSASSILGCAVNQPFQVTTLTLPVANVSEFERYEGMAVKVTQQLVVTSNYNLGKYSEIDLAPNVLYVPTQSTNATGWSAAADLVQRSKVMLGNGRSDSNVYPTMYPQGGLSATNTLRIGDKVNYDATTHAVTPLTGVFDNRFGTYLIQPTGTTATFYAANPRPTDAAALRALVKGRYKIVSANVLNFFTVYGARGAANATEFANQRTKILAELSAMNADIYGLSEVMNFNDGNTGAATASHYYTNDALANLTDGLNSIAGAGTYAYIDTLGLGASNGTDAIRSAIIYKVASVTPIGPAALYRNLTYDTNRPTLAQTFQPASGAKASKQTFTVVVNHLRSRSSACGTGDDDALQGNCNGYRLNFAKAVVNWLSTNPTGDTAANRQLILVGDFNAYYGEDPIQWFVSSGYTNLINARIGAAAYSYNYGAQAGYIDHAFASAAAKPLVTGVAEWHINADEPSVLQALDSSLKNPAALTAYFAPDAFAASDHDPILIGYNPLAGDYNDDGVIDVTDQRLLQAAIGKSVALVDARFDLDGDGTITMNDYRLWTVLYKAYIQ